MPSGTAAGIFVLPPGTTLPSPLPPGLTVVLAAGAAAAEGTGAAVAGILGAALCATEDEAVAVLSARRAGAVEGALAHLREGAAAAAAAMTATDMVRVGLSDVPAGLSAASVRSAARTVGEAVEAVHAAREAVGSRPGYDEASATAARAAQAEVDQARMDRGGALPRAARMLTMANVGAALVVAGRVVSEAFDRAFVLVALAPLAALGYAAHAVIEPARRSRAAARRRWSALRAMNVSTLAGLAALEERAAAWERRAARLTAAEAELRGVRELWRSLVGDAVALASAERLAADLDAFAAIEQAEREAARAWAESAADLQAAEDTVPAGAPLVLVDADPEADPDVRAAAVRRLATVAGATPVVFVVAEPVPTAIVAEDAPTSSDIAPPDDSQVGAPPWPAPALVPERVPSRPVPVATVNNNSGVVDLRERVRAGLLRLRARTGPPRTPPAPGSVAAEG